MIGSFTERELIRPRLFEGKRILVSFPLGRRSGYKQLLVLSDEFAGHGFPLCRNGAPRLGRGNGWGGIHGGDVDWVHGKNPEQVRIPCTKRLRSA